MRENVEVFITEEALNERIDELAGMINADYEGKSLHVVCILKGSVFFTCELTKRLTMPMDIDFMQISSYGNDTKSSGKVRILKGLDSPVTGDHVLILEDILDSGRTLSWLVGYLKKCEPASLAVCTLLDKPSRREYPVSVKYNGFEIEDKFVVGFGLDYAQRYRNLPYIGVLNLEEE